MGIIDDIKSVTDEICGLRDDLGAVKTPVYILTRVWPSKIGIGTFTETRQQILPSPNVVDLSHNFRVLEGGMVKKGDLLVKMISKESYSESQIDCSVSDQKTERYYLIKDGLYEVVSVKDKYVTFNVHVRRTNKKI